MSPQQLSDKIREIYIRKEKLIWYIKLARTWYISQNIDFTNPDTHNKIDYINNLDIKTNLHILEEWFIKIWKFIPMITGSKNDTIDVIFYKINKLK